MDKHPWRIRRKSYRTWLRVLCAAALASVLLLLGARSALLGAAPASTKLRAAAQRSSGTAFVLYTQEHGLFRQTVRSLLAGGWRGRLVVLDNSAAHNTAGDDVLQREAVEVLRTSGSLTFPQLQNVAASIALERGLDYYFCAHPGALVLGPDGNTSFRVAAERCVERWHASQPGWGLVFFGSDRLVAMRTKAAADVRWDVFVPQYRADCDFYQSLKVSGWSLLHCDAGRVVNAWQEVDVPYSNHTAAAAVLDEHARAGAADGSALSAVCTLPGSQAAAPFSVQARTAALSSEAKVAWAMHMRTSVEYYQYKWRTDECDMPTGQLPWQAE